MDVSEWNGVRKGLGARSGKIVVCSVQQVDVEMGGTDSTSKNFPTAVDQQ